MLSVIDCPLMLLLILGKSAFVFLLLWSLWKWKNVLLLLQNDTLQMYFANILQEFCEPSHIFPGPLSLMIKIILLPLQDCRLHPAKANACLFLQNAPRVFPALPENKTHRQLHRVSNLTPAHSHPKSAAVLPWAGSIPFLLEEHLTCLCSPNPASLPATPGQQPLSPEPPLSW